MKGVEKGRKWASLFWISFPNLGPFPEATLWVPAITSRQREKLKSLSLICQAPKVFSGKLYTPSTVPIKHCYHVEPRGWPILPPATNTGTLVRVLMGSIFNSCNIFLS